MKAYHKIFLAVAATAMTTMGASGLAVADEADKAIGTWLRPKTGWHVEFAACADDASKLCGTVISGEGVDKKTQGPVVGVKMLFDLEKNEKGSKWVGIMYDPKGGGTYKGKVKPLDDGRVKMSGCLLGGIVCKSEKWDPVEAMAEPEEMAVAEEMPEADDMAEAEESADPEE